MFTDGLFLPCAVAPVKHIARLATDRIYRDYCLMASRMGSIPRHHPRYISVMGKELSVPDVASFLSTYREIFVEQSYRFNSSSKSPRILDLGANIGLSVIYFKSIFPDAVITAYEADPIIFEYLEKNVKTFLLSDVELVQGAAWHEEGTLDFYSEGADGGRICPLSKGGTVKVPAYDIKRILENGSFDVLKIDIESAEDTVMPACRGLLGNVSQVLIEYHSSPDRSQQLHGILDVLADAGLRYYLESVHHSKSPLVSRPVHGGYDMQLNIFAWRETSC